MSLRYLSITQLHEVTGKDRRTIKSNLSGIEPYRTDGRAIIYDTHIALPILLGFGQDEKTVIKQIDRESLRLERAKADKIEIEVAKTRGELVAIEDVAKTVEKEYSAVRQQLISIPTKICQELSTIDDPILIKNLIEDSINEALSELSSSDKFDTNTTTEVTDEFGDQINTESSKNSETETENQLS